MFPTCGPVSRSPPQRRHIFSEEYYNGFVRVHHAGARWPAMMASLSPTDISRRNPQDEYELVQRVGSGTYGDVYKVSPDRRSHSRLRGCVVMLGDHFRDRSPKNLSFFVGSGHFLTASSTTSAIDE